MDLQLYVAVFLLLINSVSLFELEGTDIDNNATYTSAKSRRSVENDIDNQTPWHVCVNFLGKDSLIPQKCYCGGVLISTKWVISSAHCFRSNDVSSSWRKSQFQFVLGISAGRKRQMFKAKNIILHDGYQPSVKSCIPGDNDIALIELDRDVKTDPVHVKVLQLPKDNTDLAGMSCLIGDWDGTSGTDLSQETVSIPLDAEDCKKNNSTVKSKTLEGGTGGAVACGEETKYLAGVINDENRCGSSRRIQPITEYLNWIGQNTGLFSGKRDGIRGKRMADDPPVCVISNTTNEYRTFDMLRDASNNFMTDCFGNNPEPESINIKDIQDRELELIKEFISFYRDTVPNFEVYNVRSFGDLMNLIYDFGKDGIRKMTIILSKNIIIRQLVNEELRNGFLLTAGDFYCYPYVVNGESIKPNDLTDGSYMDIRKNVADNNVDGTKQLRCFAGLDNYPSKTVAHMTFASLFAESVRNWNSLAIGIPLITSNKLGLKSTITLFKDKTWPMIGGSWNNLATWGKETENTPSDTKQLFENAIKSLIAKTKTLNVTKLKNAITATICYAYTYYLDEIRPTCCP